MTEMESTRLANIEQELTVIREKMMRALAGVRGIDVHKALEEDGLDQLAADAESVLSGPHFAYADTAEIETLRREYAKLVREAAPLSGPDAKLRAAPAPRRQRP